MYPVAFNYGKTTETWIGNWLARRIGDGAVKREDLCGNQNFTAGSC